MYLTSRCNSIVLVLTSLLQLYEVNLFECLCYFGRLLHEDELRREELGEDGE